MIWFNRIRTVVSLDLSLLTLSPCKMPFAYITSVLIACKVRQSHFVVGGLARGLMLCASASVLVGLELDPRPDLTKTLKIGAVALLPGIRCAEELKELSSIQKTSQTIPDLINTQLQRYKTAVLQNAIKIMSQKTFLTAVLRVATNSFVQCPGFSNFRYRISRL